MDLSSLTDDYLDEMRTERKRRVSATRVKEKGKHREQQFECVANASDGRMYLVFTRQNLILPGAFSVGLCLLQPGAANLILCRYNGLHGHRNILERELVPAMPHVHVATERYIRAGLDLDGFAYGTDRYVSFDGALRCLIADCGVEGILDPDAPQNLELFPLR